MLTDTWSWPVNFFSHFLWLCTIGTHTPLQEGTFGAVAPATVAALVKTDSWSLIELQTRKIISYSVPHSTTCELCPLCQPYCLQSESLNCPLIPGHLISHLKVNPLVELKECKIPTGWDYNRWIIRIWVTIISITEEVHGNPWRFEVCTLHFIQIINWTMAIQIVEQWFPAVKINQLDFQLEKRPIGKPSTIFIMKYLKVLSSKNSKVSLIACFSSHDAKKSGSRV